MKTHLLRAQEHRTACGRSFNGRFVGTRDLNVVDCDVCYRSYEAAHLFFANFTQFEGSREFPSVIGVTRDGRVVVRK